MITYYWIYNHHPPSYKKTFNLTTFEIKKNYYKYVYNILVIVSLTDN